MGLPGDRTRPTGPATVTVTCGSGWARSHMHEMNPRFSHVQHVVHRACANLALPELASPSLKNKKLIPRLKLQAL